MARTSTIVDIPVARAYVPLLRPSRYKGARGGRGSAKSRFFAGNLIDEMLRRPKLRFVCIREIQRTLDQSVKRLIEDEIKRYDVGDRFIVKNNQLETPEGGIVIFQGMQDHTAESIKSLEGFNRAWVEEAQTLSQRSLDLLRPTLREADSEIWFSWNTRHKNDPVDRFFFGDNPPPDAIVVHTTWRDNPWFPDVLRAEMEWDRSIDQEKFEHIWDGAYEQHSEARVFKNWREEEFDAPGDALFMFGGDWGFSVDPTVAVRSWIDQPPGGRKRLNIDREVYRIGCEIDYTPFLFDTIACGCKAPEKDEPLLTFEERKRLCPSPELHGQMREWVSVADSARPETISYLKRNGYNRMEPAVKGPNSVKEGVIFLQGYDIRVHPRCTKTLDELRGYHYVVDKKTGLVTPILEDKKNHVIDSLRYSTEKLRAAGSRLVW